MYSEKEIRKVQDVIDNGVEAYETALLRQLSNSEFQTIKDKIDEQYPNFLRFGAEKTLKFLMYEEFKLRMSKPERLIYNSGVMHGRKSALDWVLGDTDDMFKHD